MGELQPGAEIFRVGLGDRSEVVDLGFELFQAVRLGQIRLGFLLASGAKQGLTEIVMRTVVARTLLRRAAKMRNGYLIKS